MRVLLLTPHWPPVAGGVARYTSELRKGLVERGHQVHVGALQGEPLDGAQLLPGQASRAIASVRRSIARIKPDIVHVHGDWRLLVGAVFGRQSRGMPRIVFTFHTSTRTRGARRRVLRWFLNRCDLVTAVSADLLSKEALKNRLKVPVAVAYPGGRVATKDSPDSGPPESAPRALRVVAVSPLHYPHKVAGLLDLVRAFRTVVDGPKDVRLTVAGDGKYRTEVESEVKSLGLDERVDLVGTVPDTSVLIREADVVCHVSYQDEMPLAIFEAMAAGKPILCSPVGGIPEVVRHEREGVLVEGGPSAVANHLTGLLEDPERRRRLGEAARRRIEDGFTWDHACARWETLYAPGGPKRIHISVDVEEDYAAPGPTYRGASEAVPRLLDLLGRMGVTASFFVTADIVSRFGDLVRRIAAEGHFIGSHGLSHQAADFAGRPAPDQARDLAEAAAALQSLKPFLPSFRAPNFRVDSATIRGAWEAGFLVDSSVVPGRKVRRTRRSPQIDFRGAPAEPYRPSVSRIECIGRGRILEIPVAANPEATGSPLGLGYVNLVGPDRALAAVRRCPGRDVVVLVHPWEAIDYPPEAAVDPWMRVGCTSDLSGFEAFLRLAGEENAFMGFPELLTRVHEANPRWWAPGPWASLVPRPLVCLLIESPLSDVGSDADRGESLARDLAARGFRTAILRGPSREEHVPGSRSRPHIRQVLLWFGQILRFRMRGGPLIVHGYGGATSALAMYLSRFLGIVCVQSLPESVSGARVLARTATRLDALIFPSEAARDRWERGGVCHERTAVLPEGTRTGENLGPDRGSEDRHAQADWCERIYHGLWRDSVA